MVLYHVVWWFGILNIESYTSDIQLEWQRRRRYLQQISSPPLLQLPNHSLSEGRKLWLEASRDVIARIWESKHLLCLPLPHVNGIRTKLFADAGRLHSSSESVRSPSPDHIASTSQGSSSPSLHLLGIIKQVPATCSFSAHTLHIYLV